MNNPNFVLQALKVLGPEEILKLSQVLHTKQIPLKKVAGEEFIVWDETPDERPAQKTQAEQSDAKILAFPKKKSIQDIVPPLEEEHSELEDDGDCPHLLSSELVLWQMAIAKNTGDAVHKMDAFKGYKKTTEMYAVKTTEETSGVKEKIRFASTNGILINKKQA